MSLEVCAYLQYSTTFVSHQPLGKGEWGLAIGTMGIWGQIHLCGGAFCALEEVEQSPWALPAGCLMHFLISWQPKLSQDIVRWEPPHRHKSLAKLCVAMGLPDHTLLVPSCHSHVSLRNSALCLALASGKDALVCPADLSPENLYILNHALPIFFTGSYISLNDRHLVFPGCSLLLSLNSVPSHKCTKFNKSVNTGRVQNMVPHPPNPAP